jgi:hypothetical protein
LCPPWNDASRPTNRVVVRGYRPRQTVVSDVPSRGRSRQTVQWRSSPDRKRLQRPWGCPGCPGKVSVTRYSISGHNREIISIRGWDYPPQRLLNTIVTDPLPARCGGGVLFTVTNYIRLSVVSPHAMGTPWTHTNTLLDKMLSNLPTLLAHTVDKHNTLLL